LKIGISCYPTFGGSGVIASELGMGLAERGHDVHFITYAVPGRLNTRLPGIHFHQVTVPDYPLFEYAPYSLALASKMAECAEGEELDLIHAHYAIPHATSALLAKQIVGGDRLKVITTLHGTDITLVGRNPSFMPIIRHTIDHSDALTAVSIFLHDEVCRTFRCNRVIKVIYNFINPRDYTDCANTKLRSQLAPEGEKLLVHVSNFRKVKRIDDVMSLFIEIRKRVKTRLLLIGQGPELEAAIEKARNLNIDRDLIVFGNQENVNEIIAAADVLILPSETESFGMAALEAMACGVPPVASRTGGLPEVVEHGVTGFLEEVGDVRAMTERIYSLFSDETRRREMGARAREAAFAKFDIQTALKAYEQLYQDTLNEKIDRQSI